MPQLAVRSKIARRIISNVEQASRLRMLASAVGTLRETPKRPEDVPHLAEMAGEQSGPVAGGMRRRTFPYADDLFSALVEGLGNAVKRLGSIHDATKLRGFS